MDPIRQLIDFILHIDTHLGAIIAEYGTGTYLILFLIIFCETGLVVTPFLPGDSLLFAAGAFAARGWLHPGTLFLLLTAAAILGDTINYWIGHYIGPKVFRRDGVRFLNARHLERTHQFYEKHGGKTIILARFVPIVRTFAPFVAGVGRMSYGHFLVYNVVGGAVWVGLFVFGGFYFGTLPFVEENFTYVVLAIILLSVLPMAIDLLRHRLRSFHRSRR